MNDLTPAQLFKNLQIDEVKMEYKLAEEYLKKHDFEIMFQDGNYSVTIGTSNDQDYRKVYKAIAKKIQDNAALFAQLEKIARKFNLEDIIKYDIPMIVQQFEYFSSTQRSRSGRCLNVNFTPDLPLAILGFGADTINCTFVATRETIAVVVLFTALCQEAGCHVVDKSLKNESILAMECNFILVNSRIAVLGGSLTNDTTAGSVVVITGQSDVDSAVESVCCATPDNRYPWFVKRVIVQENVYDRFKARLTNVVAPKNHGDAFEFDYAGSERDTPLVLVEAYRTTKELFALLEKYQPLYLSLWGNDISTTNEVAIKSSAQTVWINSFGIISMASFPSFYSGQDIMRSSMLKLHQSETWNRNDKEVFKKIDMLLKIRANWVKKSVSQRKAMITEVIDRLKDSDLSYWSFIREQIVTWEPATFAVVNGGRLNFGFQIPYGAYFEGALNSNNQHEVLDKLKSIVLGNGILFQCLTGIIFTEKVLSLEEFEKSGVPFVNCQCFSDIDKKNEVGNAAILGLPQDYVFVNTTKTISANFGEIFAN